LSGSRTGRRTSRDCTFAHSASGAINLWLVGQDEPIGCTARHRFWSEDRQSFVHARDLRAGERLRSADGAATRVAEIKPRPVAERVYNLEVDVEHTYYVSRLGVLAHNAAATNWCRIRTPPVHTQPGKLAPKLARSPATPNGTPTDFRCSGRTW
jgi:hypothetical protein